MRMVLAMEGLEGPNTQVQAERFMSVTGHHLEVMMVTCHLLGFAGEVAETSFLRQRKTCIVLAREACEGPNTPDQARRLMARRDRLCCLRVLGRQKVPPPQRRCGEQFPCEVAESVIGRSQNTSFFADSESERRDAVCVGVLRNSTDVHHPHLLHCSSVFCRGHGVGDSQNLGMSVVQGVGVTIGA